MCGASSAGARRRASSKIARRSSSGAPSGIAALSSPACGSGSDGASSEARPIASTASRRHSWKGSQASSGVSSALAAPRTFAPREIASSPATSQASASPGSASSHSVTRSPSPSAPMCA